MTFRARFLKAMFPLMRLWFRLNLGSGRSVRVVVLHGDDVLLIRHSYGSGSWGVPGGGLKRSEDALAGGVRETYEEVGISLQSISAAADSPLAEPQGNELWVFVGISDTRQISIDHVEIIEARWFPKNDLPHDLLRQAKRSLQAAGVETGK